MAMRDQHAHDGQAIEFFGEDALPGLPRLVGGDAAIDHGPAALPALRGIDLIFQQPQVDVVQRKGQPHAQPAHAGRDLHGAAGVGQGIAEGVVELGFKCIHQSLAIIKKGSGVTGRQRQLHFSLDDRAQYTLR
jgi:hypothetical protein